MANKTTKRIILLLGIVLIGVLLGTSAAIVVYRPPQTDQATLDYTDTSSPYPSTSPSPSSLSWSIVVTGDVIPARVVNIGMTSRNDFSWPLKQIQSVLQNADLTLINLEAPLLNNCPLTNEGFKFCGNARFAEALSESGVDVANLANNHTLNYGWDGIRETVEELSKVGIETTGFYTSLQSSEISHQVNEPTKQCNNNN